MDVVAVPTQMAREQQAEIVDFRSEQASKLAEKDAAIRALQAEKNAALAALEERMLQFELARAEVMRAQQSQQISALN